MAERLNMDNFYNIFVRMGSTRKMVELWSNLTCAQSRE